jgi:hypothetical protein
MGISSSVINTRKRRRKLHVDDIKYLSRRQLLRYLCILNIISTTAEQAEEDELRDILCEYSGEISAELLSHIIHCNASQARKQSRAKRRRTTDTSGA